MNVSVSEAAANTVTVPLSFAAGDFVGDGPDAVEFEEQAAALSSTAALAAARTRIRIVTNTP
jgi:hypothetical protein